MRVACARRAVRVGEEGITLNLVGDRRRIINYLCGHLNDNAVHVKAT